MFSPAVRGNSALWKQRRALLFRLSGKPRLPYHGRPGKSGLPGHDEDAARRRKGFLPPRFMAKAAPSLTPCKKFPHLPVSSPRLWGAFSPDNLDRIFMSSPHMWGMFPRLLSCFFSVRPGKPFRRARQRCPGFSRGVFITETPGRRRRETPSAGREHGGRNRSSRTSGGNRYGFPVRQGERCPPQWMRP